MPKLPATLSDQHKEFAKAMVLDGCNPGEAAVRAGFTRQNGYHLIANHQIQDEIECAKVLHKIEIEHEVIHTMREIMLDKKASASGRVAADRWLGEYAEIINILARSVSNLEGLDPGFLSLVNATLQECVARIDAEETENAAPVRGIEALLQPISAQAVPPPRNPHIIDAVPGIDPF